MKQKVGLAFVRVDILANWRFWNEYQKFGNYEEAGKKIIAIANALLAEDYDTDDVAAKLLIESKEFQIKRKQAGKKGGIAKAENARAHKISEANITQGASISNEDDTLTESAATCTSLGKPTKQEVYDFAHAKNLDESDAREWYEMNFIYRPGCDKDGTVIKNWKGHCKNYCSAMAKKRIA